MIKVKQILRAERRCSCDNCNREMPMVIEYSFCNDKGKEYTKLILCEDCSNAVSNLFHNVMEEGTPYKYDMDEIKEMRKGPKPIEELEIEELCSHCSLTIVLGPESLCEGRRCTEAYETYLEKFEEEI